MPQDIFDRIAPDKDKKAIGAGTALIEPPPGSDIFDQVARTQTKQPTAPKKDDWRAAYERGLSPYELAEHNARKLIRNVGTGIGKVVTGTEDFFYNLGDKLPGLALRNNPIEQAQFAAGTAKDVVTGVASAAVGPSADIVTAVREGDTDKLSKGTSRFITETIPAVAGVRAARVPIQNAATTLASDIRAGVNTLRGRSPNPVQTHQNLTDLAAVSKTTAIDIPSVHPLLQEWFDSMGISPDDIATINKAKPDDIIGDVQRGLAKDKWDALAKRSGKGDRLAPLPIEAATGAVELADRPFQAAMKEYGTLPTTQIQTQIVGQLEHMAATTIDDGLKTAYTKLADKVRKEGGTAAGLMEIKAWANKEGAALFNMSPGAQINATARPVSAYMDVGNMIRSKLYPQLKTASEGALDLSQAGAIESQAIAFRDGVWKNWNDVATQHAAEIAARTGKLSSPESPNKILRAATNPSNVLKTLTGIVMGRPAAAIGTSVAPGMLGLSLPLEQFNTVFKRGMGSMQGYSAPPPLATGPGYHPEPAPPTLTGTQADLIPHDPNLPLLEPPPGVSSGIGQDIFGVQQRANQAARIAPPETLRGTQTALPSGGVQVGPGPAQGSLLTEQGVVRGGPTTSAQDYATQVRRNQLTREMEATLPQPEKGQLTLETQTPPDLFGVKAPAGAPVPEGTKLQFVSKDRTGAVKYHYVTPNGITFVLDFEIPNTAMNKPALGPPPTR